MLKHVYNYQQHRNAAIAACATTDSRFSRSGDGYGIHATGSSPSSSAYSSTNRRSSPLAAGAPIVSSTTLPRGSSMRGNAVLNNLPHSATPTSMSTISSSSDESFSGRSSSGVSSSHANSSNKQQHPAQAQAVDVPTKQFLTEREATNLNFPSYDHSRKPSRMIKLKVMLTGYLHAETNAKEMVKMLLAKFRMRNRDANLFFITMRTTIQDRATGGLPQVTHMKFEDAERPLELNSCMGLPGISIDFFLGSQPGGLVKIKNSCLMAGATYKGLVIAPKTTAAEVIEMMVHGQNFSMQNSTATAANSSSSCTHDNSSGCGSSDDGSSSGSPAYEKPDNFDLFEICQYRKCNRPMRPDAFPLLLQSFWSNPEYYSFELRRKAPRLKSASYNAVLKAQNKISSDHIFYDQFGNKYLSEDARRVWPTLLEAPYDNFVLAKAYLTASDESVVKPRYQAAFRAARAAESAARAAARNCDTLPASVRKRDNASKLRRAQRPVSSAHYNEKNNLGSGRPYLRTFDHTAEDDHFGFSRKFSPQPISAPRSWYRLKAAVQSLTSPPKPKKVEAVEIRRIAEMQAEKKQRPPQEGVVIIRRPSATPRSVSPTNSVVVEPRLPSPPPSIAGFFAKGEESWSCSTCRTCGKKEEKAKVKKRDRCATPVDVRQEDLRGEFESPAPRASSSAALRTKLNDYVNYFYM